MNPVRVGTLVPIVPNPARRIVPRCILCKKFARYKEASIGGRFYCSRFCQSLQRAVPYAETYIVVQIAK